MGSPSHRLSPALPGAWASNWTLSAAPKIDKTHRRGNSSMSISLQSHGITGRAREETLNSRELGSGGAFEDNGHEHDGADDDSLSGDDSSAFSEDFYSFISHQDTETTLLPSSVLSEKQLDSSEGLLGPLDFSGSHFDYSELGSSLHIPAQQSILASDAPSSVHEVPSSADIYPPTDAGVRDLNNRPTSPLGFTLPNISACGQRFTAAAPIDAATRMSSGSLGESSGYECDSASAHSDFSDINYTRISNLITRLDAGNLSQASNVSWSQSSLREPAGRNTRRRDENRPPLGSEPSTLQLSQPDGDNPWTLFLDPTLTSTESEVVSESSATSISVVSSFSPRDDAASTTSRHTITSVASLRFTASGDPYITTTRIRPEELRLFVPEEPQHPIRAAFAESARPSTSTVNPPANANANDESAPSKNFLQKTKNFCYKVKKFVTLKAKKERKVSEPKVAPSIERRILAEPFQPELPRPLHQFPQLMSPSYSSVERSSTPFQRTAKMSSPSVAHSYTPEYTTGRSEKTSTGKLSGEMPPSPKATKEMKSRRRFSLPVFAASSSSAGPSNNLSALPPPRRRKVGSLLSAEGRTMRQ